MRSGTLSPALLLLALVKPVISIRKRWNKKIKSYPNLKMMLDGISGYPDIYLNGSEMSRVPRKPQLKLCIFEGESPIDGNKKSCCLLRICLHLHFTRTFLCSQSFRIRRALAHTSLRIGFGRFTTENGVKYADAILLMNSTT